MLDVTRLRVLVAVARCGSVTAAAQALNYAQPSVSHHLARLEAETGAKLLERAGRGIRLTDAGQLLAERAEEIIGRLDAAAAELAAHLHQRERRVRVAAFTAALGTLIPWAAAGLAGQRPALNLTVVHAEPDAALQLLRTGRADVAITFSCPVTGQPEPPDGSRCAILLDDPLYLVEPADGAVPPSAATAAAAAEAASGDTAASDAAHRMPPRYAADLADRANLPWIAGTGGCRDVLLRRCAAAGFTPVIACTTDDPAAAQALVAAGLGVTLLPGLALQAVRLPGLVATPLPDVTIRVAAVTFGEPPDPPATTAFIEALARGAGSRALPDGAAPGRARRDAVSTAEPSR
jgi:DNA-binding transcriptional LysR family regulator